MTYFDQTDIAPAVLDEAHVGHIHGALGSIDKDDHGPRTSWKHRLQTLLAILGPGLIVMVGDNDACAFGTDSQAGQDYGTALLWTLLLPVPVLAIFAILGGGTALAVAAAAPAAEPIDPASRARWHMPPVDDLPPARLTPLARIWMIALRGYLIVAGGLVLLRIIELATVGQG